MTFNIFTTTTPAKSQIYPRAIHSYSDLQRDSIIKDECAVTLHSIANSSVFLVFFLPLAELDKTQFVASQPLRAHPERGNG